MKCQNLVSGAERSHSELAVEAPIGAQDTGTVPICPLRIGAQDTKILAMSIALIA
jgi:hypothetical protein